jgi:hypothetical protein
VLDVLGRHVLGDLDGHEGDELCDGGHWVAA